MTHPWISSGSKRTVWWNYVPSTNIMQYPGDMRDAIHEGVMKAEEMRRMNGKIPHLSISPKRSGHGLT